jgi:hypothetical protein
VKGFKDFNLEKITNSCILTAMSADDQESIITDDAQPEDFPLLDKSSHANNKKKGKSPAWKYLVKVRS